MAKKTNIVMVRLESTADTGYFYVTSRNPRNTTEKLKIKKFDPRAINPETGARGAHVLFEEKRNKFK